MPCPTCNHTLQNVGATDDRIFWCPRCGTLLTERGDWRSHEAPRWTRLLVAGADEELYRERLAVNWPAAAKQARGD